MRNNKLWSVLLAAVLLCACVVGVLFVGAQAEGKQYYMTVGGALETAPDGMTAVADTSNYDDINAAVTAASKISWAAGDSLTIYITAADTAAASAPRHLFNVNTIFRADNTKLPITIDGDVPGTEANEKNSFGLGTPGWATGIICTNDYTFTNMDMTSWVQTSTKFFAGSGEVTFDNVVLGAGYDDEIMYLTPQLPSQTALTGWNKARFDANKAEDGLLDCSIILKNTSYGSANAGGSYKGTLVAGATTAGLGEGGTTSAYTNDIVIYQTDLRNKIVIGEGAVVSGIYHYSGTGMTANGKLAPAERVIEIDGGQVGTVFSIRSNITTSKGNKLVVNMKNGSLNSLQMGNVASGATYTGDLVVNWTGGTINTLKTLTAGTVDGNVYCNIANQTFSSFNSNKIGINGTITGTLYTSLTDCTVTGSFDMSNVGGTVANFDNTLKGTINLTGDDHAYLGAGGKAVTGNITNHIYADVNVTKVATVTSNYLYGGLNGQTCGGKITNYFYDGADIDCTFIAGSNGTAGNAATGIMTGGIENVVYGGNIDYLWCGGSVNNSTTVESIKNRILGGTIGVFAGASGDKTGTIKKVENFFGEVKEDGTYSGNAYVTKYWGGTAEGVAGEAVSVGEIENTFYAGTIGYADREDGAKWASSYNAFGGQRYGSVGVIRNTFYGGTFNVGYFYAGHSNSTASFATTVASPAEDEAQINNKLYGGHFARFAGGSVGTEVAQPATIKNEIAGVELGSITVREGAFYGAANANASASDVTNIVIGYAPLSISSNGVIPEKANMKLANTCMYGGSLDKACGDVTNIIKDGAKIGTFYGGSNSGYPASVTTTVTAETENVPEIGTYYGLGRVGSGTVASIVNNIEAGVIGAFTGASYSPAANATVTAIQNNISGGEIGSVNGGHHSHAAGTTIGSIENNVTGGQIGGFRGGSYCVAKPADSVTDVFEVSIGSIVNNIGSENAEDRPVFTSNYYGGSFYEPIGNKGKGGGYGVISTDSITNNIGYALISANSYLGDRYHKVGDVTNTINNLEFSGTNLYMGNNVGTVTGTVDTTINGLVLNGNFIPDVGSANVDAATINVTVSEGANIVVGLKGKFDVVTPKKAASVNVTVEGTFNLTQADYWYDGNTYAVLPVDANVNVIDEVPGTYTQADGVVTGKSALELVEANMLLSERVALRIVFDKAVAPEYAADFISAHVGGKNVKIEIDPENENAVIVYGIGLKDFGKEISFAGKLPALDASQNTIIKLSDYAVTVLENNKIYKAIADFGRVAAGEEAQYGLTPSVATRPAIKNAEPDATVLAITGKNLVMSDALGFRYYGTLAEGATIEDIKVLVEGTDYTDLCNIAFVGESETEVTIDFYLPISLMSAPLSVKITAGETTALDYVDYGSSIAQKLIDADDTNALAKAALVYIQAAEQM